MKIRVKGYKRFYKAISNKAHLFPVKVPIQGKNKSYYGIRWKSGTKAMEYIKKDNKIPKDTNMVFETKDGKKKGITENQVLSLYEKTGKNGSLQDFIRANFKKPKAEDNGQMSFNDMAENVDKKDNKKVTNEVAKKEKRLARWNKLYKEGSLDVDIETLGNVFDSNGKVLEKESDIRRNLALKHNNETEYMKNHADFNDVNSYNTIRGDFKRHHKLRDLIYDNNMIFGNGTTNSDYWTKVVENNINEPRDLLEFDKKYHENTAKEKDNSKNNLVNSAKEILKEDGFTDEEATQFLNKLDATIEEKNGSQIIKPSSNSIEELIGKKYDKINGEKLSRAAAKRVNETIRDLSYNLKTGEVMGSTKDNEGIRGMAQTAIDKLKSSIKGESASEDKLKEKDKALKEKRAKLRERERAGLRESRELTGTQAGMLRYRLGTQKVESKGEYTPVKNTEELVNRLKSMKNFHVDIKGRAIMDMMGLNIPLYSKRNGNAFSFKGRSAVGVCRFTVTEDGKRINKEICLVAERDAPAVETKTAVHECMHAKISDTINANLDKLGKDNNRVRSLNRLEETLVETAGQAISNLVHGNETDSKTHSYADQIARYLPIIWDCDDFKNVRKEGSHGIGKEIFKQLSAENGDFLSNILDKYQSSNDDKYMQSKYKAIETKIIERTDKVEKIQEDTGKSDIANLVEELKRGTISLEGALNSGQYRELAAVLITKFLEDEDLDAINELALSF